MASNELNEKVPFQPDCPERKLDTGGSDPREAPRVSLLIRAAKLVIGDQEMLCIIRNLSSSGVMVRTFRPIPAADSLVLEMETGDRHEVELIWTNDEQTGLRFKTPVDVARFVSEESKPFTKRPVRLSTTLMAEVRSLNGVAMTRLVNISQSGAQIEYPARLALNERIDLSIRGLPLISARVRWRKEPLYGLTFANAFRLDELGQLLTHGDVEGDYRRVVGRS